MPATRVQTPAGEVHIPRPPNAFLAAGKVGQMDMSRLAGSRWNEMTPAERKPYVEMALRLKAEHAVTYPNYKLKMGPRARASKARTTAYRRGRLRESLRPRAMQGMPAIFRHRRKWAILSGKGKNKPIHSRPLEYTRSNRPSSWDRSPPQFGTRQPGSSRNYCPDYMLEYPTQGHTNAYLDLQQQPEFGFFCPWDHDFSQPPPQFDTTWTPEYPTF
ncbi:hypothetical protein C8J57DRAFT_1469764 [Mycena rebaudengoi]|nr:hypothetical protein C8J57DRAFT_1469764 [Mycena rebaudengoi]